MPHAKKIRTGSQRESPTSKIAGKLAGMKKSKDIGARIG
jgi:hypothetical protein